MSANGSAILKVEGVTKRFRGLLAVDPRDAFAGTDEGNLEYFDTFSWPGLIKAAHAEMWRR